MHSEGPFSSEQLRAMLDYKVNVTTAMGTGFGLLRAVDDEAVTITLEWTIGELEDVVRIEDIQEITRYDAG